MADTRFVMDGQMDGQTDGRTDSAILICHPKFLWGVKIKEYPYILSSFILLTDIMTEA